MRLASRVCSVRPFSSATMATAQRQQPPWHQPRGQASPLKIYNSLTRQKEDFVPMKEGKVSWYTCGMTVYDDAHLGHARNYVTTDILLRIMRGYFKYDVHFVMNTTDVDDKIILRARQQYLLAKFREETKDLKEATGTAKEAFAFYAKKNMPKLKQGTNHSSYQEAADSAYGPVIRGEKSLAGDGSAPGDAEAKLRMHHNALTAASVALSKAEKDAGSEDEFYSQTEDVMLPYLDSLHGSEVDAKDHSIFTRLTQKYEKRFFEDMDALGNLRPDTLVRVTEYSDKIIGFVKKIVDQGFAYSTSDGSVYFDITAFEGAGKPYARLVPENRGNKALQADGEGSLTKKTTEKKSDADFALWKSSKPGEPAWDSPWGPGRPGWHIECSAMASDIFGETFDIHTGGIDLCFPHHDNELAQSEAFWYKKDADSNYQWVNYFIHMGHLSIQGSKMSKSLKNFTTVREALSKSAWTPRGLRIAFLLGRWEKGVEITDGLIKEGTNWENAVDNFFFKARKAEQNAHEKITGAVNGDSRSVEKDDEILQAHVEAVKQMHEALTDSFNTPKAMDIISNLISTWNTAATAKKVTDETTLVIADWVTEIVRTFGLDTEPYHSAIGWAGTDIADEAKPFVYPLAKLRDSIRRKALSGQPNADEVVALSKEDVAATEQPAVSIPYAEVLSQFQEDVQGLAKADAPAKAYLELCDQLRNVKLWDLGIYLEDQEDDGALVRPVTRDLRAAREEKEVRDRQKQEAKAKREEEAAKKAEKGKLDPREMFKTGEYSEWDSEGIPTKDAAGKEITKSQEKKLKKLWAAQEKQHEAWKAANA